MRQALDTATIRTDVPDIVLDMEEAVVGRYDRQRVLDLLRDLEFRTLVPRLPPVEEGFAQSPDGCASATPTEKDYRLDHDRGRARCAGRARAGTEALRLRPRSCGHQPVSLPARRRRNRDGPWRGRLHPDRPPADAGRPVAAGPRRRAGQAGAAVRRRSHREDGAQRQVRPGAPREPWLPGARRRFRHAARCLRPGRRRAERRVPRRRRLAEPEVARLSPARIRDAGDGRPRWQAGRQAAGR